MSQHAWCAGLVLAVGLVAVPAWAEERPLTQLPADMGKMATEVPKQIIETSRESTPFIGIPVGTVKGTWRILTDSYEQIQEGAQSRPRREGSKPAFRYAF